jgi:hypothetical protein
LSKALELNGEAYIDVSLKEDTDIPDMSQAITLEASVFGKGRENFNGQPYGASINNISYNLWLHTSVSSIPEEHGSFCLTSCRWISE